MASSARASWRPSPALAGFVIAALAGTIIWLASFSPWRLVPFSLAAQAYLTIGMLLAFRYWPPMFRLVASMPVVHRVVFGALIGGMILGHYTLNGRTYFPFVVWAIFPHVEDKPGTVTAREFMATTANGARVRLIVEQLFPSLVQVDRLDTMSPELTAQLAHVLAKEYNKHHAGDPVRQVDLMDMTVLLHPPANESRAEPSCELLKHYDVSSDR
jgi:hypothetical protein